MMQQLCTSSDNHFCSLKNGCSKKIRKEGCKQRNKVDYKLWRVNLRFRLVVQVVFSYCALPSINFLIKFSASFNPESMLYLTLFLLFGGTALLQTFSKPFICIFQFIFIEIFVQDILCLMYMYFVHENQNYELTY